MFNLLRIIIKNCFLILISLGIALATLEVSLRVLNLPYEPSAQFSTPDEIAQRQAAWQMSQEQARYVPYSKHKLISDEFDITYTADGNGYLGRSDGLQKDKPIITVGDSFTFGYGVEPTENFSALLGAYNAGLWGNSYSQHATAYERLASIISHNQVVWTIYPPHLITLSPGAWQSNFQIPAQKGSLLECCLSVWNKSKLSSLVLIFTGLGVNRADYYNQENQLFCRTGSAQLKQSWQILFNAAVKMKQTSELCGATITVVIIPSKTQIFLRNGITPILPLGISSVKFEAEAPSDMIVEVLLKAGYKSGQIYTYKNQTVNDVRQLFFEKDAHWNKQGHKVYADYLNELLERQSTITAIERTRP